MLKRHVVARVLPHIADVDRHAARITHDAAFDLDFRAGELDESGRILHQAILYPRALGLGDLAALARRPAPSADIVLDAISGGEGAGVVDSQIAALDLLIRKRIGAHGEVGDENVVRIHLEEGLRLADELILLGFDGETVAVDVVVGVDVARLREVAFGILIGIILHVDVIEQHRRLAVGLLRLTQLGIGSDADGVRHGHREGCGGVLGQICVFGIFRPDGDDDVHRLSPLEILGYRRIVEDELVREPAFSAEGDELGMIGGELERFIEARLVLALKHRGIEHAHGEGVGDDLPVVIFHGGEYRFARHAHLEGGVRHRAHEHRDFALHGELERCGVARRGLSGHGHFSAGETAHDAVRVHGGDFLIRGAPRHLYALSAPEHGGVSCCEIERFAVDGERIFVRAEHDAALHDLDVVLAHEVDDEDFLVLELDGCSHLAFVKREIASRDAATEAFRDVRRIHAYLGERKARTVRTDYISVRARARGDGDRHLVAEHFLAGAVDRLILQSDLTLFRAGDKAVAVQGHDIGVPARNDPFPTVDGAVQRGETRDDGLLLADFECHLAVQSDGGHVAAHHHRAGVGVSRGSHLELEVAMHIGAQSRARSHAVDMVAVGVDELHIIEPVLAVFLIGIIRVSAADVLDGPLIAAVERHLGEHLHLEDASVTVQLVDGL